MTENKKVHDGLKNNSADLQEEEPCELTEKSPVEVLREQLGEVLKTLTPREEKILRFRYGLDDGISKTLEEVGREFNITCARVRQIEAKACRRICRPSRLKKLRDFLE